MPPPARIGGKYTPNCNAKPTSVVKKCNSKAKTKYTHLAGGCKWSQYLNSTWEYVSKGYSTTAHGCMTACNKSPKCTGFELNSNRTHGYCSLWFSGSCGGPGAKGWHPCAKLKDVSARKKCIQSYHTYFSCAAPTFKPATKTPVVKGYLNLGGMNKACRVQGHFQGASQFTSTTAAKNSTSSCAKKCSTAGSKCNGFEYYAPVCNAWPPNARALLIVPCNSHIASRPSVTERFDTMSYTPHCTADRTVQAMARCASGSSDTAVHVWPEVHLLRQERRLPRQMWPD